MTGPLDLTDRIISYENNDLTGAQIVRFFADLIRTGLAWQLQGAYGRSAAGLIERGFISKGGEVTAEGESLVAMLEEDEAMPEGGEPDALLVVSPRDGLTDRLRKRQDFESEASDAR